MDLTGVDGQVDSLEDFLAIDSGAQAGNDETAFTHALDCTGSTGRKSRKLWTIFATYVRLDEMHDRFFDSTRGKIVGALRSRGAASAFDLASEFALSPNAIRQQLVILERDGLVTGKSVRRGKTKPTHEYSLTTQADRYFPQAYDRMLGAVLREVRTTQGDDAVARLFDGIAKRAVEKMEPKVRGKSTRDRLEVIADNIRHSGVSVEVEEHGDTLVLREHNCPYASVVSEHPECCTVIHTMLDDVVSHEMKQTESLATGGAECRFEVASGSRS
jgi:predicted ArsR family transcriptional regulator